MRLPDFRSVMAFCCYLVMAAVALRGTLLSPGIYGFNHDWMVPPFTSQLSAALDFRWVVSELGSDAEKIYPTGNPVLGSYLLIFPLLGAPSSLYSRLLVLGLLSFSGFSMFLFSRSLRLSTFASFLTGIFYMSNPFIFNHIAAGHLVHVESYSIAPIILLAYNSAIAEKDALRWLRWIIAGGILYAIASEALQPLALIFLILLSFTIVESFSKPSLRKVARAWATLSLLVTIVFALHAGLMLRAGSIGQTLKDVSQYVSSPAAGLALMSGEAFPFRSIFLSGYVTPYHSMTLPADLYSAWEALAFLVSMLALSASFFIRQKGIRFQILVWSCLLLLSYVLISGTNTDIGTFLWSGIATFLPPLYGLLSEIYHVALVAAMALAVLLAISLDGWMRYVRASKRRFAAILLAGLILLYSAPSILRYDQVLQVYEPGAGADRIFDKLQNDSGLYRVAWLPKRWPMSYAGMKFAGSDPMIEFSPKQALPQCCQGARGKFLDYQIDPYTLQRRRTGGGPLTLMTTSYLGYMLAPLGVKYVIVRTNMVAADIYNYAQQSKVLLGNLGAQHDLRLVEALPDMLVFRNEEYSTIIYASAPSEAAIVSGDLSTANSIPYLGQMGVTMPRLALFASQMEAGDLKFVAAYVGNVVIDASAFGDLLFVLIKDKLDVMGSLTADDLFGADWAYPNYYPWESPWATEAQLTPTIETAYQGRALGMTFAVLSDGQYDIWAKVLFSKYSRGLSVALDGHALGSLRTQGADQVYSWVKMVGGYLERGKHSLSLTSAGSRSDPFNQTYFESVAGIIAVKKGDFEAAVKQLHQLANKKNLLVLSRPSGSPCASAKVVGPYVSGGTAIELLPDCETALPVFLPEGHYRIYARLRSNSSGMLTLSLPDVENPTLLQGMVRPTANFSVVKLGEADIRTLRYTATLSSSADAIVDRIVFVKPGHILEEPNTDAAFMKVNPAEYVVRLNSTDPVFLTLTSSSHKWTPSRNREPPHPSEGPSELHYLLAKIEYKTRGGRVDEPNEFRYLLAKGSHSITFSFASQSAYEVAVKVATTIGVVALVTLAVISIRIWDSNRQRRLDQLSRRSQRKL